MIREHPRILLVNPACQDPRISGEDARVVPIGLFYIGALLLENGFKTDILNLADAGKDPIEVFIQRITDQSPDIIGFSVTGPSRWNAVDCARQAKKILPRSWIVFGGPSPTFLFSHFIDICPDQTIMVRGEGEQTFLELVQALAAGRIDSLEAIPGLAMKKNGRLVQSPDRSPLADLDSLPHPSKHFTYRHLALSRGCPGTCTFCGSPDFWGTRRVRFHSASWLFNEIRTLAGRGVSFFYISDDTFTLDRPRVLEFCRLITAARLPVTWNAISRTDRVDEELLSAMRRAGCIQISYGVESGSEAIRKTLGKPTDRDMIVRAFSLTAAFGILPRAYFIYGSPGETPATIRESVALMEDCRPLAAVFYMLVIFPGTRLYQRAEEKGRVSDVIWHQRIEDLPWFEIDPDLDSEMVLTFGNTLRQAFYSRVDAFARNIRLTDCPELAPFHADFLSRLGMTFSHGEYARDSRVKNQDETARHLFEQALLFSPDPRAFLGLGMLAQKGGNMDEALRVLDSGLDRFPKNRDLSLGKGISLMNQKRFSQALDVLEPFAQDPDIRHYVRICRQKQSPF